MGKLESVLTITEVAKKLNIGTSTIRMRLKNNTIPQKYFRKTEGGEYLFLSSYIDFEQKKKGKTAEN